jgi:putative ABC transport system permease protein
MAADVFFQFSFEASLLALTGSTVGVVLGWFGTGIAASRGQLPFVFDSRSAALAFGSAVALNLAFSSWPARRASQLDPIAALKHE